MIYVRTSIICNFHSLADTAAIRCLTDARSVVRFQADHVNRHLIPAFYRYLQAQEEEKQVEGAKDFVEAIEQLVEMFQKAEKDTPEAVGLWREDGKLGELTFNYRLGILLNTQLILRLDRRYGCAVVVPNDKRVNTLPRLFGAFRKEDLSVSKPTLGRSHR